MRMIVDRASMGLLLLGLFCASNSARSQEKTRDEWLPGDARSPTKVTHLSGGCTFIINDLQGGSFQAPSENGIDTASVNFDSSRTRWTPVSSIPLICTTPGAKNDMAADRGANELSFRLGAMQVNGEWVPVDLRDRTCDPNRFPKSKRNSIHVNSPCFYPDEHFNSFEFHGKNWRGIGTLLDATTGEPKFRQRTLTYCLIPEKASSILCGYTQVRYLKRPREDLLSQIMRMLTSLEFVDLPALVFPGPVAK